MTARHLTPLRIASLAALSVVAMTVATPAYAADGDVRVVNTETVQVYTSPSGSVQTRRVYEQLSLYGNGTVDVKNPISTNHLRNLDGFGGFDVENGEQVTRTSVNGEKKLRSVSNYGGQLPLTVAVRYQLDGRTVEPGHIVGKSGKLDVEYTVENVTGKPQEVTFDDGKGGTVTKTVDVPIPMVGSLSLVAPSTFTNVASKQANIAGDGKGGTKLSFTMTLFPPIGSTTAVFGYTADIKDGVVPRSDISALPVNPLDSPTFKTAADSYKGGADTGVELTDGAGQIDENLLKLRDGAGDLLAGLIKLRDGASQLNSGLAGQAAPGAAKLAGGASELDSGLGQLNAGAKRLADGAGEAFAGGTKLDKGAARISRGLDDLASNTPALDSGARRIAAGQKSLLGGVQLLERGVGVLPDTVKAGLADNKDYKQLIGTLGLLSQKIGTPGDSPVADPSQATLFSGLNALKGGLRAPTYSASECLKAAGGDAGAQCGVSDALKTVSDGLKAAAADIDGKATDLQTLQAGATQIYNFVATTTGACTPTGGALPPADALASPHPACVGAAKVAFGIGGPGGVIASSTSGSTSLKSAAAALDGVKTKIDHAMVPGIDLLKSKIRNPGAATDCKAALGTPTPADDCGLQQVIDYLASTAIPTLVDQLTLTVSQGLLEKISAPAGGCQPTSQTLLCGAQALADGGGALTDGTGKLLTGSRKLKAGGLQMLDGTDQLADGLGRLNDGAGRLAEGTTQAKDGSGRLSAGAGKLAGGLTDAADGSGRLAGGLKQAAGGAPQLVDGAQKLSDQGTKKLVQAGELTAQNYGEMYATMTAGAKRAQAENMAYGAPADAIGLTAYSYVIQGDDGEGGRNLVRGLGGLAILGAAGGVFGLRRRLV